MSEDFKWDDLVPAIAKPAIYAYKYRHFIQQHWKSLQIAAGIGTPQVLVTGRSGVGKSVLVAHYHGEANSHTWNLPASSPDVEIKPISIGDWTKIVSVVPGQDSRERTIALDNSFNKFDGLEGVIHVVDWGYTAVRDEAIRGAVVSGGVDTVELFRQRNLRLEIEDFNYMIERMIMSITNNRGPKWLLVAVNKIDLYLDQLKEARGYYHPSAESEFSEAIQKLYRAVGANNVKVACVPVCSCPEPFSWNGVYVRSKIDSVTEYKGYLRRFIEQVAIVQQGANKK